MSELDPTKRTFGVTDPEGKWLLCCDCDHAYPSCNEYSQFLEGKHVLFSFSRSFTAPPDHLQGIHANFEPLTVDMSTIKNPPFALEYVPGSPLPDRSSDLWSRIPGYFEYTVSYFEDLFDLSLYQICRDWPSLGRSQIYIPYPVFRVQCSWSSSYDYWFQTTQYTILWKAWHYPTSDGDPDPTTQAGIDYLRDEATSLGGGDQDYRWELKRRDLSDHTILPTDLLTSDMPTANSWDDVTVSVTFQ